MNDYQVLRRTRNPLFIIISFIKSIPTIPTILYLIVKERSSKKRFFEKFQYDWKDQKSIDETIFKIVHALFCGLGPILIKSYLGIASLLIYVRRQYYEDNARPLSAILNSDEYSLE